MSSKWQIHQFFFNVYYSVSEIIYVEAEVPRD